ncbi:MAG: gamma-glutamylcyclotransferase family protein [Methylococcales bacterium]
MINYFAYGSNMFTRRLIERVPSARAIGIGKLTGHHLQWHKKSTDGSAKCDIEIAELTEQIVWGVLFSIDPSEKGHLDKAEGLGYGYEEKTVSISTETTVVEAITYYATKIDNTLPVYDWYKAFVLAGAEEHDLPFEYLQAIKLVADVKDPDNERRQKNFLILNKDN